MQLTKQERPVDVLHVITGTGTGGAERMLVRVCDQLRAGSLHSAVVSLQSEGATASQLRSIGVAVHSLEVSRGRISIGALGRLRAIVATMNPQIVQGWMYHGNVAATLSLPVRNPRPALAWNVRQALYDLESEPRLTRWVIRASAMLSRRAAAVIYNSAVSRTQHEALGFAPGRSRIIDNGFDLERFQPDERAAAAFRELWGLASASVVFGCVARSHPVKNHPLLIEAFANIYRTDSSARLLLIGEGMDHDNLELGDAIDKCGARGGVILAGPVTDIPGTLAAMDVVCLASRAEGFPNVVGEAMACERPCIVTDVGDSARIVGDCGWVVPRNDCAAFVYAMRAARALGRQERAAMGARARTRIADEFSIARVGAAYLGLYQELMTRPARP